MRKPNPYAMDEWRDAYQLAKDRLGGREPEIAEIVAARFPPDIPVTVEVDLTDVMAGRFPRHKMFPEKGRHA